MTTDGDLRRLLREHLTPRGFWLTTIETGVVTSGVPDVYWCHAATRASGWIECKTTGGWTVGLRPHQIGWLRRHASAGVRGVVAVRARGAGSGGTARDALWVVPADAAERLAAGGLSALDAGDVLVRCEGSPRQWDWQGVAAVLVA